MNELFKEAIVDGASDIHIKAGDFVRARVDGEMELVESGMVAFGLAKAAPNSPSDFDLKMNILGGPAADSEPVKPGSEIGGFTS